MSANRHSTSLGQLELVGVKFKRRYECRRDDRLTQPRHFSTPALVALTEQAEATAAVIESVHMAVGGLLMHSTASATRTPAAATQLGYRSVTAAAHLDRRKHE